MRHFQKKLKKFFPKGAPRECSPGPRCGSRRARVQLMVTCKYVNVIMIFLISRTTTSMTQRVAVAGSISLLLFCIITLISIIILIIVIVVGVVTVGSERQVEVRSVRLNVSVLIFARVVPRCQRLVDVRRLNTVTTDHFYQTSFVFEVKIKAQYLALLGKFHLRATERQVPYGIAHSCLKARHGGTRSALTPAR